MKARSQGPDNTCTLMLYSILNCSHSLILSPLFCDLLQAMNRQCGAFKMYYVASLNKLLNKQSVDGDLGHIDALVTSL